jgi:hypothetical protein
VTVSDADGFGASTGVEQAELAVATGGREGGSDGVPGDALDRVLVAGEGDSGGVVAVLDVPDAHEVVAAARRQEILGGRVEGHMSDLAAASVQLARGGNVGRLPSVVAPAFEERVLDVPDEDWVC